jgi:RND family efflux transporter MFP subunit
MVKAGQRLAALRAGSLAADVASASARVQQAEADLRALQEGSRPEDIAVSEAEIAGKKAALETAKTALKKSNEQLDLLRKEAVTSLAGTVVNVGSSVSKELTTAQNALSVVRDTFSNNDVVDAIIKYDAGSHKDLNALRISTEAGIAALYKNANPQDFEKALALLDQARQSLNQSLSVLNQSVDLITRLPETTYFTESVRQAYKADLNAQRSVVQSSFNTLDVQAKSLRDASANFSTRIAAEEASVENAQGQIDSYEASLKISQAQLDLKKAPTRETDLQSAQAIVRQYRAALARASSDYGNTILTAPIAGRITKVHVKTGEYTPGGAAVAMLGDSPFRVEMYVSEIDVPKLQITQSGSIELDAFRDTQFKLRATSIDTASTDRDGVPKYRVLLDFVYPHDELKIGMTGDARIVTGIRTDVVSVPLRAVLERDDGTSYVRIQQEDGTIEELTVETGLEGEGGSVEVVGVESGTTVIVLEKK